MAGSRTGRYKNIVIVGSGQRTIPAIILYPITMNQINLGNLQEVDHLLLSISWHFIYFISDPNGGK